VRVGEVGIGGLNPIRIQSMITSDTRDTEACVREILALAEVGCEIVRLTAQTRAYAENLEHIARGVREAGCGVPLVADIHFKPDAALEAAKWVEKVRVNPGNYADTKKFEIREYTDIQYEEELGRIREQFAPLVRMCRELGRSIRIGTNHGSLSDRIMNRFGDTPLGMVESALEFARIARDENFHQFAFSMKASNPKVMIEAYRLLVARLDAEGPDWNYPIHLGVTEAGDGEDGRIKSAIGIGSLLADGIGDTVRVSLTEDAIHEIPVAKALVEPYNRDGYILQNPVHAKLDGWKWGGSVYGGSREDVVEEETGGTAATPFIPSYDPFSFQRRKSKAVSAAGVEMGGENTIRVLTSRANWEALSPKAASLGDFKPEGVFEAAGVVEIDPRDDAAVASLNDRADPVPVSVADGTGMEVIPGFRLLAARIAARHPIILKDVLDPSSGDHPFMAPLLEASARLGSLLCDGIGDAVFVRGEEEPTRSLRLAYNILQAAGARIFKADYVACPSCGRTLFNLQDATRKIRAATGHLKGVRIAVMGCIVNGPGEMADADFGYVGGAPGKINLYVSKTPVKFNIPEADAVERLVGLIREHGRWIDPPRSD